MTPGFWLRPLLIIVLVFVSAPLWAETRIEASNGVAAYNITNSPITIGMKPDEQLRMAEIFSQQITVSSEARAKAEVRAAELGKELGFTQAAVIGFFRIVCRQGGPVGRRF